eukprot:2103713-Prymnesium_polylepis.1
MLGIRNVSRHGGTCSTYGGIGASSILTRDRGVCTSCDRLGRATVQLWRFHDAVMTAVTSVSLFTRFMRVPVSSLLVGMSHPHAQPRTRNGRETDAKQTQHNGETATELLMTA